MGYYTDFSGSIELPGLKEKERRRLENILKKRSPFPPDEIGIKKMKDGYRLEIYGNWKNYDQDLDKLVMAIVRAFPDSAQGWIDAFGEERDDRWALEIGEGKVMYVTYEEVVKDRTVYFDRKGGRHCD